MFSEPGQVKSWKLEHKPKGISVTQDGKSVIVSCQEERVIQQLATETGVVIRTLRLPEDMKSPWHTVYYPTNSTLLVSHGNIDDTLRGCVS